MITVNSESAYSPEPFEETPKSVFTRTDIIEGTKEQEDGTFIPWFTYTENQYTTSEWREIIVNKRIEAIEKASGTGGETGTRGIASRLDSLEDRIKALEGTP